jgi:hypothetical protein
LLHLIRDNNATTNTVLVNRAALRFVYVHVEAKMV